MGQVVFKPGNNDRDAGAALVGPASIEIVPRAVPDGRSTRSLRNASLSEDSVETVIYRLSRPSLFVGSQPWKVDICLQGEDIAEVHCEVTVCDLEVRVCALDTKSITLNGVEVREGVVNVNDELGVGSYLLRLTSLDGEQIFAPVTRARPVVELRPASEMRLVGELRSADVSGSRSFEIRNPVRVHHDSEQLPADEPTVLPLPEQTIVDEVHRTGNAAACHEVLNPESREVVNQSETLSPPDCQALPVRQFFIIHAEIETGPIPADAVQQLLDEGTLTDDSPMRSEEDDHWQTCRVCGFTPKIVDSLASSESTKLIASNPPGSISADGTAPLKTGSPASIAASATVNASPGQWQRVCSRASQFAAIIPLIFFQLISLRQPSIRLVNFRGFLAAMLIAFVGILIWREWDAWSHRALTGRITYSTRPVAQVVVSLTCDQTGQQVAGFADVAGRFTIYTRSGTLAPGIYRVRLSPNPGLIADRLPPDISEPILATSKSTIVTKVVANQSEIVIELTDTAQIPVADSSR
jgi:hypothetical protein